MKWLYLIWLRFTKSRRKLDKAIEVYRNYMEINPARINLRVKIGELLIKEKKYEEAQKEFQEVLKVDPDNRDVRIALGLLYYDMRRLI